LSQFEIHLRDRIDTNAKIATGQSEAAHGQMAADSALVSSETLYFRPITTADLDEVMVIERMSFRFPWSAGFFLQELQVPCARSILAELGNRTVGYILFWLLPEAIDIHNIAVHLEYRRRGIARALLGAVIDEARRRSFTRVMLEVRRSNTPAQTLYRRLGFATTGIRKGYYSDDGEDALAMTLDIT
jgi:ribosomal-protein-alanine N-acetyltransferase